MFIFPYTGGNTENRVHKYAYLEHLLPKNPKTNDFDITDLLITLIGIPNILKENDFTEVIWTGDIIADFSRDTKFVSIVGNFVNGRI